MPGRRRKRVGRYLWTSTQSTALQTLAVNTQTSAQLLNASGGATGDQESHGATLRRIVGEIQFQAAANSEAPLFKAAIYTINEDALDAGAIPDLFSDAADFMWTRQAVCNVRASGQFNPHQIWTVDVRVGRRLPQSERDVVCTFESGSPAGNIQLYFFFRTLIWVP